MFDGKETYHNMEKLTRITTIVISKDKHFMALHVPYIPSNKIIKHMEKSI